MVTATHCNTLQHTATHCNTLQHKCWWIVIYSRCNIPLQHTATHCNTLQHIATHWLLWMCACSLACISFAATLCNISQHTATHCNTLTLLNVCVQSRMHSICFNTLQHTATWCNTLQHTATHCNTLQHTVTHCNTLQHTDFCECVRAVSHAFYLLQHTAT